MKSDFDPSGEVSTNSAQAPGFWPQFHKYVQRRPQMMAARAGEIRGAPLSDAEVFRMV